MKPIDKFILHVVHNLFPLNEYSEGEIKYLLNKFKEEAEDLNIQVSDEQLKKYIERFDKLKDSPKVTDKDLRKYSLSKLIKIVTSSPGTEVSSNDEDEDQTPDVVYNDNGITIWNGAKQGNCITYGASQKTPGGTKWCITTPGGSYWGKYRYGASYKLSFVALQVLDNGTYKFTNRNNSPGMEGPFGWEELNSRVPWLKDIPNVKNILKYIPFSKKEKESELFKNNPISIKQWMKEPFNTKKQYLIVRSGLDRLFSDISNDVFILKYLPQYPQIANMIATTEGIIDIETLIKYIDKFSKQDQLSIASLIRSNFNLNILDGDSTFDLKKYLVKTNKINLNQYQRLYVTKDNKAIVLLTLEDDIKVGLYTEDDEYPNIKLNKRTSKYLLDYSELDKIPLKILIKLTQDEVIDKEIVDKVIDKAKTDPDSAVIVKDNIILDSNSFTSYKIEDGKLKQVSFDNEDVQAVFAGQKDNEGFQQNALNLFNKYYGVIPKTIDKDALINVIKAIPYSKRIIDGDVILTTTDPVSPFILMPATVNPRQQRLSRSYGSDGDWRKANRHSQSLSENDWKSYFIYLRATNQAYNNNDLLTLLGNERSPMTIESKRAFIANNPPITDGPYKPAMNGDTALLINVNNPSSSYKISDQSGKLVKANVPSSLAAQLLGPRQVPGQAAAQANAAVRAGRGRPAGQPNAPRPQAAPIEGGTSLGQIAQAYNLTPGFNALGQRVLRRFPTSFEEVPVTNNRGASRRQNLLGANGSVRRVFENGNNAIYIIRLNDGPLIASVVLQPGNSHYIVTPDNAIGLGSPSELLNALRQRNLLAELHQYIVNEYFDRNPHHLSEFRQLLRKHINEKKKQNENK